MTTAKSRALSSTQQTQAEQAQRVLSVRSGAANAHSVPEAAPQTGREGKVEVSARAIATIAARAAVECYGVVGIAPRHARLGGVAQRLAPEVSARGVEVRFVDDHVVIDVWVILEHSLRVVEVAHNIMVIVKYEVEQALGLHVAQVNVNVQALRVRQ
ncbi:MAG TPA: Asp23/Gls24 family envelope stress response protein [Ktedonobacterales bacterium]|jgi:uncharacterized alkaline shock family protein YloU|nr:Asp23/Gls24 family envelope stress response protein [Ktedonobacterales bacterium]